MLDPLYPLPSRDLSETRKRLAPEVHDAFQTFSQKVFAEGALPAKTKQLIAVAVAHVTQCPYCIKGHTKAALRQGATREELMEAIGSRPRCGPGVPMPIRFLRSRRWRRQLRTAADRGPRQAHPRARGSGRRLSRAGRSDLAEGRQEDRCCH